MKVVIEPVIGSHPPELYSVEGVASRVAGFDAVDDLSIDQYREQGFLVIAGGFNDSEVQEAKNALETMTRAEDPQCESIYYEGSIREHLPASSPVETSKDGDVTVAQLAMGDKLDHLPHLPIDLRARYVRKFAGFTNTHAELSAIANNPAMLNVIERLIGEPIRQFQDMAMIKPPAGREKPWHQDHAYFNLPLETRIVGVWIALDHVNAANGGMHLLAGGHKLGPRPHFMRRDWQICDTDMLGTRAVCAEMAAGDVLLFDAKLPHGTPTNQSSSFRWAIQLHYVPASCVETAEEERLSLFGNQGRNVTC